MKRIPIDTQSVDHTTGQPAVYLLVDSEVGDDLCGSTSS